MKRKLVKYPDPILDQVCEPYDFENPQVELDELLSEMKRILAEEGGIGLAAPQVGVPVRVFIVDGDHSDNVVDNRFEPMVFINPTVTPVGEEKAVLPEGCLSFPISTPTPVERPLWVTVDAKGVDGVPFRFDANLLLGRIIQHENDHLNGKTLISYTKGALRELMKSKIRKESRK